MKRITNQMRRDLNAHVVWVKSLGDKGRQLDWRYRDLRGYDLSDENLAQANLTGSCLNESDLCGADLSGATLVNVMANEVNFLSSDLGRADLSHGMFCGSVFKSANMKS